MGASSSAVSPYVLQDDYLANNTFFDKWNFWTDADPTHGFVQYVNQSTAAKNALITSSASSVYIGVDYKNVQPYGRPSVRIQSKKTYDQGLIIVDLAHMPGSICGAWPAFWSYGPNWPNNGEIDIIEGVNMGNTNLNALHTSSGCSIVKAPMTGTIQTNNCDVNAPGQYANAGCGIVTSNTSSYGDGFNAIGGGVYATVFSATNVTMWFFQRNSIPADITAGKPTPATWGTPASLFTGCDFSRFIKQQQLVFDTTFCGDWAGNVWGSSPCAQKTNSCPDYVANNPSAFKEAYWTINALKVYAPIK